MNKPILEVRTITCHCGATAKYENTMKGCYNQADVERKTGWRCLHNTWTNGSIWVCESCLPRIIDHANKIEIILGTRNVSLKGILTSIDRSNPKRDPNIDLINQCVPVRQDESPPGILATKCQVCGRESILPKDETGCPLCRKEVPEMDEEKRQEILSTVTALKEQKDRKCSS